MANARKLKVYQAVFGFYDSVVAAANQAAALQAWGTRQNLFAEGQAKLTTDPAAQEAALANPETPLRRPIGTSGAFSLAPDPPKAPTAPARKTGKVPPTRQSKPAPPDRSNLTAAEDALARIDDDKARSEADLRQRRQALDAEEANMVQRWRAERREASRQVELEKRAYRIAGGK